MTQIRATLPTTPQIFPGDAAPVPQQYKFILDGPVTEMKTLPYTGVPLVSVLFDANVNPGDYTVTAELLAVTGARIGPLSTAAITVTPPPINIKVTYPKGKGIVITLEEI